MKYSNVIDTPRSPGSDDLLGVDRYVMALSQFISVAQMPTTLAIQGEWGSGKTSLMNQVRYKLCEMPGEVDPQKLYHGIWINTWQYALMRSPEEALISVIQGITAEVLDIMRCYQSSLSGAISKVGGMFGKLAKVGAKAAVTAAGADASLLDELTASGGQAGAASFRQALCDAISDCLEEDRKAGNNKRGFIFFIDDLDRLDPPVAVQILELLKNLFEVDNCIFILAIDYEVVVKGLIPKFGPLTEKNEREFRSFFDKIIQLPFSMPVSNYNIDTYLAGALEEIGYFNLKELSHPFGKENTTILEHISEMALLSTGSNPRSVKRLINSLSLIRIMHSMTSHAEQMSAKEKLLNFGFVCIQTAYPSIYDMLLFEPNYKNWDEKIARRFRATDLDDALRDSLGERDEFDEEWEQILYRICRNNSFLAARAYSISRLLNLIAVLLDSPHHFGEEVGRMLSFAAVTTVSSNECVTRKAGSRVLLGNVDEYLASWREKGAKEELLALIPVIIERFTGLYGERIRLELAPRGGVGFHVVNSKGRERRLAKIDPRKDCLSIYTGDYGPHMVRTLKAGGEDSLPENFYAMAYKRFMALSLDTPPPFSEE